MEAPKEMYLNDFGRDEECEWFVRPLPFAHSVTKYIRADIAELTWEDIDTIVKLHDDVMTCAGGTPKDFCEETLRRFNEIKNK